MQTQSMNRNGVRGFTLVELLVVVAIIALVTSLGVVAYNGVLKNTAESASISGQNALMNTINTYATLHSDKLPNGLDSLLRSTTYTSAGGVAEPAYADGWTPANYLNSTGGTASAISLATAPLKLFNIGKDQDGNGVPDDGSVSGIAAADHWGLWTKASNCPITTSTTGAGNGITATGSGGAFHSLCVGQLTSGDLSKLQTLGITYVYDVSSVENSFHGHPIYVKRTLAVGDPAVFIDPVTSRAGAEIYRQCGVDLSDTTLYTRTSSTPNNDGQNLTDDARGKAFSAGRFIVLGIGDYSTLIGDRQGGTVGETPLCGLAKDGEYNKYMLVVKVSSGPNDMDGYPVMVLDCRGQPPSGMSAGGARGWATRTK
jgi:prepilin-type N-terminal cleavage/methylation domain-containing protein